MYSQGAEFNCKGTSCYGVGKGPDGTFRRLQQSINTAASVLKLSLPSLTVDGLIGPQTVKNLVEIGRRVSSENLRRVMGAPNVTTVAALAAELIAELAAVPPAAGTKPAPPQPVSTPVKPTSQPASQLPAPISTPQAYPTQTQHQAPGIFPDSPPRPNRQLWWIAGGVLGAATLIGLGVAIYAKQRGDAGGYDGADEPEDEGEAPG